MNIKHILALSILTMGLVLSACSSTSSRGGMVVDPETGLQFGSVVSNNMVVDADQFSNSKLKLVVRNTSGDTAFDLHGFKNRLLDAYAAKGYEPVGGKGWGVRLDVNVVYSGQVTRTMADQYAWIGALGGTAAGLGVGASGGGGTTSEVTGSVIGAAAGATLGAILGSYQKDETYIVITDVTLATMDPQRSKTETTIVFGGKAKKKRNTGFKKFTNTENTGVACFAGGRNISQADIAAQVRERFIRILSDII